MTVLKLLSLILTNSIIQTDITLLRDYEVGLSLFNVMPQIGVIQHAEVKTFAWIISKELSSMGML